MYKMCIRDSFRRMQYVRYADDFLISVIGSKSECETIKADICLLYTSHHSPSRAAKTARQGFILFLLDAISLVNR